MPPGSGMRAGIDRDEDGFLDRDELDAGSDPADPLSTPLTIPQMVVLRTSKLIMKDDVDAPLDPNKRRITFNVKTKYELPSQQVVPPLPGSAGDPTVGGATLQVYNADGVTTDAVSVALPASGWSALGSPSSPKGWRFRGDASAAIRSIVIKRGTIILHGGRSAWAYSLDEASQGRIALRLALGTDVGWCTATPADAKGTPPTTARSDHPGYFKAGGLAAAPATCPPLP